MLWKTLIELTFISVLIYLHFKAKGDQKRRSLLIDLEVWSQIQDQKKLNVNENIRHLQNGECPRVLV